MVFVQASLEELGGQGFEAYGEGARVSGHAQASSKRQQKKDERKKKRKTARAQKRQQGQQLQQLQQLQQGQGVIDLAELLPGGGTKKESSTKSAKRGDGLGDGPRDMPASPLPAHCSVISVHACGGVTDICISLVGQLLAGWLVGRLAGH